MRFVGFKKKYLLPNHVVSSVKDVPMYSPQNDKANKEPEPEGVPQQILYRLLRPAFIRAPDAFSAAAVF